MLDIKASDSGSVRTIELRGEFDLAAVGSASELLEESLSNGFSALTIDLRGLTFLDSSGLRVLVLALKQSRTRGVVFSIIPGATQVQKVFEVTGLAASMPFTEAPADA